MAGYVGNVPVPQSVREDQSFTATAGQTTFNTLGYTDGNRIKVTLNGVLLEGGGVDYTATNGSDVVLTVAAVVDDIVRFETFNEVQLVNSVTTSPTFKTSATLLNETEEDTDGGRESTLIFQGEQSGGELTTLAEIEASHAGTSDDEKGHLIFRTNDGNDGTSPTERLRINSGGDMLFSSEDPSLTLANTTHEDSDGGRESTIAFQGEQSGGEISTLAQIEAAHDGTADDQKGDLIFRTNDGSDGTSPTTAMIIDSAQNVGINAVPKVTHADADVIRFGGTGYIANWEDAEVYLSENMYQDTSGNYKYLTASHASLYSQTTGMHQFKTAGSGSADAAITFAEKVRIDSDGLKFNGDTAAANALDDYEEGSFNLTMIGYYGNPSTTQLIPCQYTKVGNTVHFWGQKTGVNNTGASGNMWFSGLPFTAAAPYSVGNFYLDGVGTFPNSSPFAWIGGTIAYVYKHTSNGTATAVFHNVVTSGSVQVQGTYKV